MDAINVSCGPKGNILQWQNGHAYVWDSDNDLKSVTVAQGSVEGVTGTHTYEYDALGRRAAKVIEGDADATTRTIFVCVTKPIQLSQFAGQVVAEYESLSGAPTTLARKYAYGSYIDEPLVLIDRTSSGPQPAAVDELFHYHQRRLYSVSALTDNAGAKVERYVYTSYGDVTILASDGAMVLTASSLGNTYMFTGRRNDPESGLHFCRSRYYDWTTGRFIGRDPVSYLRLVEPRRLYPLPAMQPAGSCGYGRTRRNRSNVGGAGSELACMHFGAGR